MTLRTLLNRIEYGQTVRIIKTLDDSIVYEGHIAAVPVELDSCSVWSVIAKDKNYLDIECIVQN